jgi:hypothetical protein
MNLLFKPIGIIAGFIAGFVARKAFDRAWSAVDGGQPPDPEQRNIPKGKLLIALALEGIIFTVVRGMADHYSRVAFYRYTGAWPGEADEADGN